jgi:hypothetical protein
MAYLNCPECKRRLRVPDSLEPLELRCPACRHAFRSDGDPVELRGEPEAEEPADELDGDAAEEPAFVASDATAGRMLSQADEAMLREYGSGSGLLELTREAYSPSSGPAPAGPAFAPQEAASQSKGELDRQFQIIGTALTLANKLVLAHKGELARTRRQSSLGWALLAAMTLSAAALGWWAVSQSGQTNLAREQNLNMADRMREAVRDRDELKVQAPRRAEELSAERADHKATLAELKAAKDALSKAKEDLAFRKGETDTLTAELAVARRESVAIGREVDRLGAELTAARAAAYASDPASRPATTRSASTRPADANSAVAGLGNR